MIRRCTASTLVLAAATLGMVASDVATAQEPDPNVPVQDRPRPDFDPLGIRAGGFLVFPRLRVAGTYDSNVFAVPDDEEDDFITVVSPSVSVRSNFPRHALNFDAGAAFGFYLDENDENFRDFFAGADGRLDVTREGAVLANLRYSREHEPRESPDQPEGAEEPTEIDIFSGQLGYQHNFNRLNFRVLGGARYLNYHDVPQIAGGTINQDDRDRLESDARLRVGYRMSPRINLFTEGRYTRKDYRDTPDDQGFDRDSQGFEGRGGVDLDLTGILFGEIFGGYRYETFEDDAFDNVTGFSFGAGLTWNVTRLTTIQLTGLRDVEATTQAGAGGNFRTDVRLDVHHELLRNLLLNALAGYRRDDFQDIDRTDNTFSLGAGLEYLVNRNLAVDLGYRFDDRNSDFDPEEFSRHRVTVGLTGRL